MHLFNTLISKHFSLYFREGDYIIMVEKINVTSFDAKKLDQLIQTRFQNKTLLNICFTKARAKPSAEFEVKFQNVSEIKEVDLSVGMVFRKRGNDQIEETPSIKDYDVIEKVIDSFKTIHAPFKEKHFVIKLLLQI